MLLVSAWDVPNRFFGPSARPLASACVRHFLAGAGLFGKARSSFVSRVLASGRVSARGGALVFFVLRSPQSCFGMPIPCVLQCIVSRYAQSLFGIACRARGSPLSSRRCIYSTGGVDGRPFRRRDMGGARAAGCRCGRVS